MLVHKLLVVVKYSKHKMLLIGILHIVILGDPNRSIIPNLDSNGIVVSYICY